MKIYMLLKDGTKRLIEESPAPPKLSRVTIWLRSAKEFWYMLTRGRFLIIARETRKRLMHTGGGPITVFELVGNPLYANVYKGLTWTEVPRGATVVTFLAGALLIWKLRKNRSSKDYSLISVQDMAFLETIYSE